MNMYKLKHGISEARMITRENFMNDTKGKSPYFKDKWDSQLAICPHCENPIQIVGLFSEDKINPSKRKPYGKCGAGGKQQYSGYLNEVAKSIPG